MCLLNKVELVLLSWPIFSGRLILADCLYARLYKSGWFFLLHISSSHHFWLEDGTLCLVGRLAIRIVGHLICLLSLPVLKVVRKQRHHDFNVNNSVVNERRRRCASRKRSATADSTTRKVEHGAREIANRYCTRDVQQRTAIGNIAACNTNTTFSKSFR